MHHIVDNHGGQRMPHDLPQAAIDLVVRTHMAPVTGLEREVAILVLGRAGSLTDPARDRERR